MLEHPVDAGCIPIVQGRLEPEGRTLRIIRQANGSTEREIVAAPWGLISAWSHDASDAKKTSNACAEAVAQMPSFRAAVQARRRIDEDRGRRC